MAKLSEPEILAKMPIAKGWERHGDMLVRSWQFPSFRRALEFVNQVAAPGREVRPPPRHHPELPQGPARALDPLRRRADRPRLRLRVRDQCPADRSLSRSASASTGPGIRPKKNPRPIRPGVESLASHDRPSSTSPLGSALLQILGPLRARLARRQPAKLGLGQVEDPLLRGSTSRLPGAGRAARPASARCGPGSAPPPSSSSCRSTSDQILPRDTSPTGCPSPIAPVTSNGRPGGTA